MKHNEQYYLEGMTLIDKINFISDKLETIRDRLEDIADDMCRESLFRD